MSAFSDLDIFAAWPPQSTRDEVVKFKSAVIRRFAALLWGITGCSGAFSGMDTMFPYTLPQEVHGQKAGSMASGKLAQEEPGMWGFSKCVSIAYSSLNWGPFLASLLKGAAS